MSSSILNNINFRSNIMYGKNISIMSQEGKKHLFPTKLLNTKAQAYTSCKYPLNKNRFLKIK